MLAAFLRFWHFLCFLLNKDLNGSSYRTKPFKNQNMNCPKPLIVVASVLSCALLSSSAQAQLSYNVSADSNPAGVFSALGGSPILWDSGDISLPSGTMIGTTPLEIDLTLSHNVTLDNAPSGVENLSYGLWFGYNNLLPAGTDAGTVKVELLENGVVLDTSPTSSPFGFGVGTFTSDEAGLWDRRVLHSAQQLGL
jgi:hypothetical protein